MLGAMFFFRHKILDRKHNRRTRKVALSCITLYPNIIIKDTMLVEFPTNGNNELAFASVDLRLPLPEDGSSRAACWIFQKTRF